MLWRTSLRRPVEAIRLDGLADGTRVFTVACSGAVCILDLTSLLTGLQDAGLLADPDSELTVAARRQRVEAPPRMLAWAMPAGTLRRRDAHLRLAASGPLSNSVAGEASPLHVVSAGAGPALCRFLCVDDDGHALLGVQPAAAAAAVPAQAPAAAPAGPIAALGRVLQRAASAALRGDMMGAAAALGRQDQGEAAVYTADLHDVLAGAAPLQHGAVQLNPLVRAGSRRVLRHIPRSFKLIFPLPWPLQ